MSLQHYFSRPARIFLLGLLLTAVAGYLINEEPARLERAAAADRAARIIEGAALYASHCTACHGTRGKGIGHLGPALNDRHLFTDRLQEVGWQLGLDKYIQSTTSHGRLMATRPLYAGDSKSAVMAPWANQYGGPLRESDIAAITEFIMNWQQTASGNVILPAIVLPPPDLASPKMIERGRKTFQDHCLHCHGFSSVAGGGAIGPDLSGIAARATGRQPEMRAEDYLRESVVIPDAFIVEGYRDQAPEQGCGAIISEEQLQALTGFLLHEDH